MSLRHRSTAVLLATVACFSCAEPGSEILDISATGTLAGVVFLDRDGDLVPNNGIDSPIPALPVTIIARSGLNVASVMTDSAGRFRAEDLPAGSYRVVPDPAVMGDSVRVLQIDNEEATVAAHDTARMVIAIGYPASSIRSIRTRAPGSRVALHAVALNSWATFGDSTVHFADSTGVIRALRVRDVGVFAGDSVRLLATTARQSAQPVLEDVTVIRARRGTLPAPVESTTGAAAAGGATLYGEHVRIRNAIVIDGSSLVGGDLLLTINDGSGPLGLLLDVDAGINTPLPIAIGAELDVSGLLVPGSGVQLVLKPRGSADITVRYRPISIAEARARATGQYVVIQGVALNDLGIFGDLGLHVADNSGAIRVRSAQPGFVSTGDSVSVLGQITRLDGQPALMNSTASVISRTVPPAPLLLTTLNAAGANGGIADAVLVRVENVLVKDTITVGGELHLFVDDNTGIVEVILDRDAIVNAPPVGVNTRWDITGLLVQSNVAGVWWIKPRSRADLVAR